MKKIDLHTHTRASDGLKTPAELIDLAVQEHVGIIAITDHDTVQGVDEALTAAQKRNIRCIPGIEFSVEWPKGAFHLVGLGLDHANRELCSRIDELARLRDTRAARMIADLNRNGINITLDEVTSEAAGGVIGKPHVARVLVRHGYAPDFADVFTLFLEEGKPGFVKKEKISFDEAAALIVKSGGIPILAHPVSLELRNNREYEMMIADLKERGLAGIEVYADMHGPDDVAFFHEIAVGLDLIVSGGSDYHGDKDERIGYYNGTIIPFDIYDSLQEYLL